MTTNTPDDFRRCRQRTFTDADGQAYAVYACMTTNGRVWLRCPCREFAHASGLFECQQWCRHTLKISSLALPLEWQRDYQILIGNCRGRIHSVRFVNAANAAGLPARARAPRPAAPRRFRRIELDG